MSLLCIINDKHSRDYLIRFSTSNELVLFGGIMLELNCKLSLYIIKINLASD